MAITVEGVLNYLCETTSEYNDLLDSVDRLPSVTLIEKDDLELRLKVDIHLTD